ncbi:hypothetical protein NKJ46_33075, partial [Mesorhizobium sp. M0166]|uniref:hypothetical protein n=1 Tax=unclassified Mesorhizobium TaxID=325217 RepID=UPI0033359FB5
MGAGPAKKAFSAVRRRVRAKIQPGSTNFVLAKGGRLIEGGFHRPANLGCLRCPSPLPSPREGRLSDSHILQIEFGSVLDGVEFGEADAHDL